MKKLLTIMVLALALCLVCSAALAADALQAKYDTLAEFNTAVAPYGTKALDYDASGSVITLNKVTPVAEDLKKVTDSATTADHAKYFDVRVTGMNGTVEVTAWTRVRHSAHFWVEDTSKTVRSCTGKWNLYEKCAICGAANPDSPKEMAAMDHVWKLVNNATCTEKGYYYHVCTTCGVTEQKDGKTIYYKADGLTTTTDKEAPALGHNIGVDDAGNYNIKIVAPGCKEGSWTVYNGSLTVLCARCGKVGVDNKPAFEAAMAAAHYPAGWSASASYVDGKVDIDVVNYRDDLKLAEASYDGHKYTGVFEHVDATCAKPAGDSRRCDICGYQDFIADPTSTKLPVKYVLNPAKDLTCKTLKGKVAGDKIANAFTCANCNGATHKAVDGVVGFVNGADYKDGYTLKLDTTDPDYEATEDITVVVKHTSANNGNAWYDTIKAAPDTLNGNTWASINAAKGASTKAQIAKFCGAVDAVGSLVKVQNKKCSVCDQALNKSITNVTHDYGNYVTDVKPTNTLYTRYCNICGNQDSLTYLPCDWIGKDHVWNPDPDAVAALECGKAANILFKCDNCRRTKMDNYTREHNPVEIGVIKEATCTEKGTMLYRCSYANCGTLIEKDDVAPAGHKPVAVAEVPATCKAAGTKAGFKCEKCGKFLDADKADANVIEALEVIPASDTLHVLGDKIVKTAATCKAAGVAIQVCSVCGKAVESEIVALPHTWDAGTITKEPTKDAKGEKTFKCTVCGETKTEEMEWVPAEPAKYTLTDVKYSGSTVTGKLVHDDTTVEAADKKIRVTFYIDGGYYMATMAEVDADGNFSVDGVGPIIYITVGATGNTSVNPEAYAPIADAIEIVVK